MEKEPKELLIAITIAFALFGVFYVGKTILTPPKDEEIVINHYTEEQLQSFHSEAYEQGYQEAIWDVYLGEPRFLIDEDAKGNVTLWAKQAIDQHYIDAVGKRATQFEEPEEVEKENE